MNVRPTMSPEEDSEWTTDNEMLTPSFKVKLRNLLAKHDDEIKAIA
ncbi:MAG: hypothetical protein VXV71_04510 [Candidatus Thermoplasmatota archaeon]|nr:hypothetical protein [Candidatus Thermoplasmatota archaeon]